MIKSLVHAPEHDSPTKGFKIDLDFDMRVKPHAHPHSPGPWMIYHWDKFYQYVTLPPEKPEDFICPEDPYLFA